jgi:hypothetical protein
MTDHDIGASRWSDPNTSHAAADTVNATRLEDIVYVATFKAGDDGLTWDETAAVTGLDKASVSPRFAPMMRKKMLRIKLDTLGQQVKRSNGRSGRQQLVRVAIR